MWAGFRDGELGTTQVENAATTAGDPIHRTAASRIVFRSDSEEEEEPPLVVIRRIGVVPANPPNPEAGAGRRQ